MPSPCTGVCTLDAQRQYCLGCHRSLDEIIRWGGASDRQRQDILDGITRRRAQIDASGAHLKRWGGR